MAAVAARDGVNPLFELETGRMTEAAFLRSLGDELTSALGQEVELHGFGEQYFENLHPNEQLIDYMRELRDRGYKLAICTNNVREWEQLWRAKLPVEEIFDVVVDSAFVGTRKPEPQIYEITLSASASRARRAAHRRHRTQLPSGSRARDDARSGFARPNRRSRRSSRARSRLSRSGHFQFSAPRRSQQ